MNNTTNTDILKYISEIESLILLLKKELTQDLQEPTTQNFARENKEITTIYNNGSLYDVFTEIDDIIDYYINNIGFPNVGKQISSNQLKFKTIKFLEKNSLNKTVIFKIIETLKFDKNITYDLYLSKIQSNMRGKKE